ncbi:28309_t:CDS:10 [Dentiscutata erythropus]|uniref:28309_t:CDS:1 n=1 Tax=Dentiscutata erythropus TaxID=1348616 RepID=A0A9N8VJ43_9GLOM|nr:28309_t:CDS:10 [Dentiscutata erythropus]
MFAPRSSRPTTVAIYPSKSGALRRKKKGENVTPAIELERILGLTASKSTAISTAPTHDLIAYAAGSVVVLYNHKKNKQVGFLHASSAVTSAPSPTPTNSNNRHTIVGDPMMNPLGALGLLEPPGTNASGNASSKKPAVSNKAKPISCLAFSPDGNYLAVGETGHQPRILIWDVSTKTLVNELKGHKYGVLALEFSPNMKWIVSLGFQVHTLAFNRTGSFFVTAGLRHVKYWYFDSNGNLPKKAAGQSIQKTAQVLDGRSGILGDLRDNNFLDAACCQKSDHTYFVTSNGLLCMFTEGRLMDKWVNLQVKSAYSIDVSQQYIICACSNGIVRLFEPITLNYLGTLPKPHPLGVDLTLQTGSTYGTGDPNDTYPDTTAIKFDAETGKLTCIYSDRSLFIWDIKDVKKIGKYRSFLYHCDTIWGVEMIPPRDTEDDASPLPENTFVTYSADSTIRFWNFDGSANSTGSNVASAGSNNTTLKRNIYSKECMKIIYVDPEGKYRSSALETKNDKSDSTEQLSSSAVESGIRTLKISPDGKLMASGDRGGNLRVHDLDTFKEITYQEAHDAEILTIEFTDRRMPGDRDRILHVFDVNNSFQLIQTLDDHSSSITAIKFTNDGGKLISCGADKSIIFRSRQNGMNNKGGLELEKLYREIHYKDNVKIGSGDSPSYVPYHNISGRATVFDMDIDISNRYIATVSGERRLNVYHIDTGKNVRSYKSDTPEEVNTADQGSLLRISLDPGGVHAVTGGSDKSIRLFDFTNGSILGKVLGHSELITGVKFTSDCERVISTSADGCIFVWKISDELVSKMRQKWLDRSGVSGLVEKTSPIMRDYPSSQSSIPPPIQPRTTMPAQKSQSLMVDLQQSSNDDQELGFSVRRATNNLKIKKSYSSLSAMEHQNEDNTKKFVVKRPVSYANDGSSQPKSTQSTTATRFSLDQSKLPTATSSSPSNTTGLTTPPNTPTPLNSARRESWKIGLPSWAKKAFKEKEEEKRLKDNVSNSSNTHIPTVTFSTSQVQDNSNSLNMEKKLPAIPKPLNRSKSQSKLRQDATKSLLGIEPEKNESKPVEDQEIIAEDSCNEDNETIYVESPDELEGADDNGNISSKRRRSSFNGSIKIVEFGGDRPKSSSGSEKDNDVDSSALENDNEENDVEEDIESTEENVQKLEDYLNIDTKRVKNENGHASVENEGNSTLDNNAKKRQSLTMKFYTGSQRNSNDSNGNNSLIDALTKIIGNQELVIREDEGGIMEALEALEKKSKEIDDHSLGQESDKRPSIIYSTPSSPATPTEETADDVNLKRFIDHKNNEEIKNENIPLSIDNQDGDDNESFVNDSDLKADGLGISISKGCQNNNDNELDANVTNRSSIDEINEDSIMEDVLTMTVLLERTLLAYKKVSLPSSKNEGMAKLISESLNGMMDDIRKCIEVNEELTNNHVSESTKSRINVPEIVEPGHDTYRDEKDIESKTQNLLEKYSDLLVKMVEEKMVAKTKETKVNVDESTTSSINDNTLTVGTPAVNGKYTKPTKSGMIPVIRTKVKK